MRATSRAVDQPNISMPSADSMAPTMRCVEDSVRSLAPTVVKMASARLRAGPDHQDGDGRDGHGQALRRRRNRAPARGGVTRCSTICMASWIIAVAMTINAVKTGWESVGTG